MSALTLETLPPEVMVYFLDSFSSFEDLYALISASPVYFGIFKTNRVSLLTSIARRIAGKDNWEAALQS